MTAEVSQELLAAASDPRGHFDRDSVVANPAIIDLLFLEHSAYVRQQKRLTDRCGADRAEHDLARLNIIVVP
jgi:hypothetical protein